MPFIDSVDLAGSSVNIFSGGATDIGSISAASDVFFGVVTKVVNGVTVSTGTGLLGSGDIAAGGEVFVLSENGSTALGAINAGGPVTLSALNGGVAAGDLRSGLNLVIDAGEGGIAIGTAQIVGDIVLTAAGDIGGGAMNAGDDILIASSGGAVDFASLLTTGTFSEPAFGEAGTNIMIDAARAVTLGSANAAARPAVTSDGSLTISGQSVTATSLRAGDAVSVFAENGIDADSVIGGSGGVTLDAGGAALLVAVNPASGGSVSLTGSAVTATATGGLTVSDATATDGSILLAFNAASTVETASATGSLTLTNGLGVDGTPDAARTITAGILEAGTNLTVQAAGDILVDEATAGTTVLLTSASSVNMGIGNAGLDLVLYAQTSITGGEGFAGRDLEFVTRLSSGDTRILPRSVTLGSGEAGDDLILAAFGRVEAGTLLTTGDSSDSGGLQYGNRAGNSVYIISEMGTAVDAIDAAGNIDIINIAEFRNGFQISDGSGDIAVDEMVAGGFISAFNTSSDILFGDVQAGSSVTLSAQLGAIETDDILAVSQISLRAGGDIDVDNVIATAATGSVLLSAGDPFGGQTTPYRDGDVDIGGVISARASVRIDGGDDVFVRSEGGSVRSDGTITIRSGDDTVIESGAIVGIGAIDPADILLLPDVVGGPADAVTINAGVLRFGNPNFTENGRATANVAGSVFGVAISLISEDIVVASAARIGDDATDRLDFRNLAGMSFLGGEAVTTGYSLSNAEFGRATASLIGFTGASGGDVTVGQLDIVGTGATGQRNLVGDAGGVVITSSGSVIVNGAVTLAQAGGNDQLGIIADQRIDVVSPTGSLRITGANGALAGTLFLDADRITVASAAAAQEIEDLATVDEIDERLGRNDGAENEAGYLQAGRMAFSIRSGLFIQNSGTGGLRSALRRGFTVGAGGVRIATIGDGGAAIVINGRQEDGAGGFLTGVDLIPELAIDDGDGGSPSFDQRSTANGCLIVGFSCRFDIPDQIGPPIQDVFDEIIGGGVTEDEATKGMAVVQALNLPIIELVDFSPFSFLPVIDEPVTGAGNDDLWLGETRGSDEDEDEDEDEDGEGGGNPGSLSR